MKPLVLCADDFAVHGEASRGIAELAQQGRLSATSAMVLSKRWTQDAALLQDLRGQTHTLYSGVACAFDGDILFSHVSMARMSMRAFTDAFLDHYMETVGDSVLASVGCYQLEGPGIQLFEAIDGDYFTILGLPLLPLLTALREFGCIDD